MTNKKLQEQIYLRWFLKEEAIDCNSIEEHDPPDFYIQHDDKRVAIEITNLYLEAKPSRKGSKFKRQESQRNEWLRSLEASYYSRADVPLWVVIQFSTPYSYQDTENVILDKLCSLSEGKLLSSDQYLIQSKSGPIKLDVTPLPQEERFKNYSGWQISGESFGVVSQTTREHIHNAFDKKKQKIHLYRSSCDEVWLLLVADSRWQSGMLRSFGKEFSLEEGVFASVWLLEYDKKTIKLLG